MKGIWEEAAEWLAPGLPESQTQLLSALCTAYCIEQANILSILGQKKKKKILVNSLHAFLPFPEDKNRSPLDYAKARSK